MSADPHQFMLAALGGLSFGFIISWWIGTNWRFLALMMVVLWVLMSGPQMLYRALEGRDVSNEVVVVTLLRTTFLVATVIVVAIGNRRNLHADRPGAHWPWRKED